MNAILRHIRLDSASSRTTALDTATIVMFGLLALVFVQFAPFTGDMAGAVDITTRQTSPYMEEHARFERSENPLQTDQVDGIALAVTFWDGVKSGELRMWEPNLGTGVPLGGVTYTRVWSPFYWIGAVVPAQSLSAFAVWLALWSAQAGAWLLARRLGIGRYGAFLTGVAYGFSGPSTALLLRINEIAIAPWVILATHDTVVRREGKHIRRIAVLSMAVAIIWLGGFPAGSMFVIYGAAAIAIGTAMLETGPRPVQFMTRVSPAAAGIAGGTLLALPLLLPSLEFLGASESLQRAYSSSHAAGIEMFGTSISGRILGSYPLGTWWWPDPGYSNPVAASATTGAIVIVLLLVGVFAAHRSRPDPSAARLLGRVYLPLGGIIFVGTFLGGPILGALQLLPFMKSNEFGRSRFLLSLALALAAGLVLDGLVRPQGNRRTLGVGFRLLAGATVVASLWGGFLVIRRAAREGFLDRVVDGLTVPMICLVIAAAALLALPILRRIRIGPAVSVIIVAAALAVELQWGAWEFTPIVDEDEGFFPQHNSFEIMRPDVSEGLYRFAGTALNVIRPNTGAWLDLADLRVSNPSYEGYREFMRAIDPGVFDRARLRTWFTDELDPSSPGLDRSAVLYLVAPAAGFPLEAEMWGESPISPNGSISVSMAATPIRGVGFQFDDRCRTGFLAVRAAEQIVGQRPLWQIRNEPFVVTIEDFAGAGQLEISIVGCDLDLPSAATLYRADPETDLAAIWADDAVVYRRLSTLPRFGLATAIEGIRDPAVRLRYLAESEDTHIVVLNDDRPLTYLNGGHVDLLEDSGDHLKLEVVSDGPGMLVARDSNAPGWRAFVDGDPVEIQTADHAFRAVSVPAGTSTVEFTYLPTSRLLGFAFAGATLIALLAGTILERRLVRRRLHEGGPPTTRIT
ncbi:MAG: YfhO family protein [bacterium]|nr:YfhO family protein [bacterium]